VLVLLFAGCAAQTHRPARFCPGKKTAAEAITELNQRCRRARPVRAAGQCLLRYHIEGKERKENFPVKLWVNPPDEVYLQGDIAFDAAGLVLGSNADEFWFWLKPKEVSTYWWGKWSQAYVWNGLVVSPSAMLEAFGDVNVLEGVWSLTHGRFDILWLHSEQGALLKRMYIDTCDYVAVKIEYFDSTGEIVARAEFADYEQIAEGLLVPARMRIVAVSEDGSEDFAEISLTSVGITQLNEQQRHHLFVRPKPQGFDHIYRIVDGAAVEQKSK
jgi:hypothetical protein